MGKHSNGMRCLSVGQQLESIIYCCAIFGLLILATSHPLYAAERPRPAAETIDRQTLIIAWSQAFPQLSHSLISDLQSERVYRLYETQIITANILRWAAENNEQSVLQDLASLYAMAFPYARKRQSLTLPYAGPVNLLGHPTREWKIALPTSVYAWLPRAGDLFEPILSSAQFLYGVARLSRALVVSGASSEDFLLRARLLLLDHMKRWVFGIEGVPGTFQTTGWGCSVGTFTHTQHVDNLRHKFYGTDKYSRPWLRPAPKHCNAVTDTDLFLIMIAGEIVMLDRLRPAEFGIEPEMREKFKLHLRSGLRLIRSRLSRTQIKHPAGGTREGLLFDASIWDEHPGHRYSDYEDEEFPGWVDRKNKRSIVPPKPALGVGWDISHARRFVYFLDTIASLQSAGFETGFSREDRIAIARQLVFGPWNGSLKTPRFTNFNDGTNGWYRVNYRNRPGFGYPPFGLETQMVSCGYGFLQTLDPAISRLLLNRRRHDLATSSRKWNTPVNLLLDLPVLLSMKSALRNRD